MDDVIAKSAPKVSPAQRRTASACSTGSAMPSNRASAAGGQLARRRPDGDRHSVTPVAISRTEKARRQAPQRQPSADSPYGVSSSSPQYGQWNTGSCRVLPAAAASSVSHSNQSSSARAT